MSATDAVFYVIMVPMVYAAFVWCAAGIIAMVVRVVRTLAYPHTLNKIFPEKNPRVSPWFEAFFMPGIKSRQPALWFFLGLFHIGLALLIIAHLDILPQISIMPADSPHLLGWGAVGAGVVASLIFLLLFRRFSTPVREISVPVDYLLLFLLFLIVLSGNIISWGNSWSADGFVITKQDFGQYFDSLLKFSFADPRNYLAGSHYAVVAMHVLLANLFLILLPFSKVMHFCFAVPLNLLRRT